MWSACSIEHVLTSQSAKEKGFIDIVLNEKINNKKSYIILGFHSLKLKR